MFPLDAPVEEDPNAHKMYVRSHFSYAPGEQRRRNYDWSKPGIDPTTHKFGAVDKDEYREGVKKALQPALDQTLPQPPGVANKILEDWKMSNHDYLGQSRKLGTGDRQLPEDYVYGMPSLKPGFKEPGVEELLKSSYPEEQQQPDADLGKSLREVRTGCLR